MFKAVSEEIFEMSAI